jgi:hypothetical protein
VGLYDSIREAAADVFGWRDDLEQARLMEADAKLIARKAEDLGWDLLNASHNPYGAHKEPDNETRREQVRRAYNYFYNHPIVGQAVSLNTWYVFGRGLTKPKYRPIQRRLKQEEAEQQDTASQKQREQAQDYIDRFWFDEDNQRTLSTHGAQEQKSNELQLQGNVFLLMFRSEEKAGNAPTPAPDRHFSTKPRNTLDDLRQTKAAPSERLTTVSQSEPVTEKKNATVKVTDLPEHEIVDVIMHPENRKLPVYYKREYTPRIYNFESKTYEPGEKVTIYYRDWKHEAPKSVNGEPWGPKPEEIGEGVVYHIKVNAVSDAKFGQSEVARILKWAKGLDEYMTSRMAVVQALAQIALQAKVKGGAKQVSQVAAQLADISNLANQVEGATTTRDRADLNKTKVALTNQGTELIPAVQDTGASSAMTDIQTIKGQLAAGLGLPMHYLGDVGSANLATATAMELPVLKMMEARQELWEGVFRDIIGYMLEGVGLDPEGVEVQMPSILARDVNALVTSLAALVAAVDPQVQNAEMIRWVVSEILDAMGKVNTEEILDKIFPDDWAPPPPPGMVANAGPDGEPLPAEMVVPPTPEVRAAAQEDQAAAAQAQAAARPAPAAPAGQKRRVAAATTKAKDSDRKARFKGRNGTDRAPSARGGTSSSQRAAQARQDRASGRVGQSQTLLRYGADEELPNDEQLVEAPPSHDSAVNEHPEVAEALAVLDGLAEEIERELGDDGTGDA